MLRVLSVCACLALTAPALAQVPTEISDFVGVECVGLFDANGERLGGVVQGGSVWMSYEGRLLNVSPSNMAAPFGFNASWSASVVFPTEDCSGPAYMVLARVELDGTVAPSGDVPGATLALGEFVQNEGAPATWTLYLDDPGAETLEIEGVSRLLPSGICHVENPGSERHPVSLTKVVVPATPHEFPFEGPFTFEQVPCPTPIPSAPFGPRLSEPLVERR